jgi:hypothetical protein
LQEGLPSRLGFGANPMREFLLGGWFFIIHTKHPSAKSLKSKGGLKSLDILAALGFASWKVWMLLGCIKIPGYSQFSGLAGA